MSDSSIPRIVSVPSDVGALVAPVYDAAVAAAADPLASIITDSPTKSDL